MLSIAVRYLFEATHLLLVGRLQSSFAGPCPVVFFFFKQIIVRIKTFLWFHLHSRITKLQVKDEIVQIRMAETRTSLFCFSLLNLLMLWFCF